MKQVYFKILVIAGFLSLACTTRVSEWVLLNALPNQYTLVFFHNGPPGENIKKQNQEITDRIKNANIRFKTADRKDIKEPYYGLYYEDRLFSKFSNPAEMKDLTTSPLREKVAAELMGGKICVMLYLKTGIREKDDRGMQTLKKSLDASPFGGIITVVELSRNSTEEAHFANMLLNVEDDLKTIREPMLFGVFGKFKALEPLLGKGITEENISLMIDYLTAECSCLIKDDLPGTDILFTDKWDNPRPALLNKIIDDNPLLGE
ncbi:MAG TPA: hypothetical protein VMV47_03230 [Bacteroidales bacterium]|nr:hypothetical protein [Bacteroidales bacterium]